MASTRDEKRALLDDPPHAYGAPLWPDDEPPAEPRNKASWTRRVPAALTVVAQGTAPFISTFLLIHLSAPIAAAAGGSSLASQVMVRELEALGFNGSLRSLRFVDTWAGILSISHVRDIPRQAAHRPAYLLGYSQTRHPLVLRLPYP
jgi:hypothetical protein